MKGLNLTFFIVLTLSLNIHAQPLCTEQKPETFTVHLPLVTIPPDEEGHGWDRPNIWGDHAASADEIEIPNGRPIYALIVSGYSSNAYLDELMLYNFARFLMDKGA